MSVSRRDFLRWGAMAAAAVPLASALPRTVNAYRGAGALPSTRDPVLHFLNRISYGVLPHELERARQIGVEAYLEEQLNPLALDDSAADALLRRYPILTMDRRTLHSFGFDGRVYNAIIQGMIVRAVYSTRQLYERMVEFWTDHFNVPADEQQHDLVLMHRDVIRRHALGNFRDLLIGTARSPAMLYYLDQAYSSKEHPNENYARELLELHTLGVDGGYTERDVQEAARALTGFTVHNGIDDGFYFDMEMHDTGVKSILGHNMPAERGIEDGLHLLSITVNHPETVRFVCRKLCVRFVSDYPSAALVESAAQVWQAHNGAIVPVLRHILQSEEFYASAGQKLRRPLDFFIGALRVTGTTFRSDGTVHELVADLAQPPYGWGPPNGYPDVAGAWLSTSGLLARWNTAISLTHAAYSDPESGMDARLDRLIDAPATVDQLVDQVALRVFGGALPAEERAPFVDFASDGAGGDLPVSPRLISNKLGMLFGLMLASPLYQWR